MQQSKKLGPSMNIMYVKSSKAIFYVFLSILGLKNTQFYKYEIFIPQNPMKKKRKNKYICPNPHSNMQQRGKNRPFMNIMCVIYNKAIFYVFIGYLQA
jgi:hypothetical protein